MDEVRRGRERRKAGGEGVTEGFSGGGGIEKGAGNREECIEERWFQ